MPDSDLTQQYDMPWTRQGVVRDPGYWRPLAIGSIILNVLLLACACGFGALAAMGIWMFEQSEPTGQVAVVDGQVTAAEVERAAADFLGQTPLNEVPDDLTCEPIDPAAAGATSLCTGTSLDLPVRIVVRMVDADGAVEFFEQL